MRSATAQRVDTMILINRMRQPCMPHVSHAESWGIRLANSLKTGKNRQQKIQKIPLWHEAGAG